MVGKLHKVYHLSGTPYEIGLQHGKRAREITQRYVATHAYGDRFRYHPWRGSGPTTEEYTLENYKEKEPARYAKWQKLVDSQPKWMLEEIRGLADGAGVDYEKLLICKGNIPVVFESGAKAGGPATPDDGDGCNGFVAFGRATVGGEPIVAGNSEGTVRFGGKGNAVFLVKNEKMNNLVLVQAEHGTLGGHAGINDKGVALFGSGVACTDEEFGRVGLESQVVRRKILQTCDNIDDVYDFFKENPLIAAKHLYIADTKRAVHVEFTGRHIEFLEPEEGFSPGASPTFFSPTMQQYNDVLTDETDPRFSYATAKKRGAFRMERYMELFAEKKPLTPEKCPELVSDHGGRGAGIVQDTIEGARPQPSDYTICVHGKAMRHDQISHRKLGQIGYHGVGSSRIIVPGRRTLYECFGRPCQAGFTEFKVPS
jgi:isopenicillin-N N-acyltransferase-like protein